MIERHWNAELIATVIGLIFLAVGLLGFVPNPVVSDTGFFRVNAAHNYVHLVTGLILLAAAYMGAAVMTIRAIAIIYALVAILGFVAPQMIMSSGFMMNMADQWLHVVGAAILLFIGFAAPMEEHITTAHM